MLVMHIAGTLQLPNGDEEGGWEIVFAFFTTVVARIMKSSETVALSRNLVNPTSDGGLTSST